MYFATMLLFVLPPTPVQTRSRRSWAWKTYESRRMNDALDTVEMDEVMIMPLISFGLYVGIMETEIRLLAQEAQIINLNIKG